MEYGKEINSGRMWGQAWRNGVKYLTRKGVVVFYLLCRF